jgi:hypothetical protein
MHAPGPLTAGSARELFHASPPRFVVAPALLTADECARMVRAVYAAREAWNDDFGGAQFSLGRAFYTHFETGQSDAYFAGAKESDALVERALPGMQAWMRALCAALTGGHARQRRGWCGAGVHVFPAGGEVARRGGVKHFDVEGLNERHMEERRRALSVVLMLQAPERGGGLRLWDARYHGEEHATRADARTGSELLTYDVGSAMAMDSYRLHQIQPFSGTRDRLSITLHAAELDTGLWETWF